MQREKITSTFLKREVTVDVYLPRYYHTNHLTPKLLVMNDGQDAGAYKLHDSMVDAEVTLKINPVLALAVHVGERKQEYGITDRPDFAYRGGKAGLYAKFIEKELLPWARKEFRLAPGPENAGIAGFSLGALSAFDVAWQQPHIFSKAGLFSGSFWWRSKALDDGYQPSDRIALELIQASKEKKPLQFWFQTGWMDESADRDGDGLIDSIGDTLDVLLALQKKGYVPGKDLAYIEMGAGHHDHKTMAKALPQFLQWFAGE